MATFRLVEASSPFDRRGNHAGAALKISAEDSQTGQSVEYMPMRLTDENIDGLAELLTPIFQRRAAIKRREEQVARDQANLDEGKRELADARRRLFDPLPF